MRIIVVGCGRIGAQLVNRLFRTGAQVTVIDVVPEAFDNLDPDFRGHTIEGDVMAQDMLRRAGIEQADGLAAVTSSDSLNVVVGHIARTVYNVENVIARNYEPRYIPLYEAFGIQSVAPANWGAQRMEEMLCDCSLRAVFSAGNGEVEVYELLVSRSWGGRRLDDLLQCASCVAVALTRGGTARLPAPDTILGEGDVLHVSATFDGIELLRKQLAGVREA
jgi:trk system potassium uptake protein